MVWLLGLVLVAFTARAQSEKGAVTGTISDSSGAVVPGAEITVTNVDTNVPYSTVSTGTGTYRVLNLPPGNYNVKCGKEGFKQTSIESVRVAVSATVNVDRSEERRVGKE